MSLVLNVVKSLKSLRISFSKAFAAPLLSMLICLNGFVLCSSCAGNHSYWEFVCAMDISCPEGRISHHSSSFSGAYIIVIHSLLTLFELWWKTEGRTERWAICQVKRVFCLWRSTYSCLFLALMCHRLSAFNDGCWGIENYFWGVCGYWMFIFVWLHTHLHMSSSIWI